MVAVVRARGTPCARAPVAGVLREEAWQTQTALSRLAAPKLPRAVCDARHRLDRLRGAEGVGATRGACGVTDVVFGGPGVAGHADRILPEEARHTETLRHVVAPGLGGVRVQGTLLARGVAERCLEATHRTLFARTRFVREARVARALEHAGGIRGVGRARVRGAHLARDRGLVEVLAVRTRDTCELGRRAADTQHENTEHPDTTRQHLRSRRLDAYMQTYTIGVPCLTPLVFNKSVMGFNEQQILCR